MRINFTFSIPFERSLNNQISLEDQISLVQEDVQIKIEMLKVFWSKYGQMVEDILEDITGCKFKEEKIDCYLNSRISVSHPFCLKFNSDDERMKDTVVHELIHILFKQNNLASSRGAQMFKSDFENEHVLTYNHIILHAIHLIIAKRLFPERVERIQQKKNPHYLRSWEIVNQYGAENLVKKYLKAE